MSKSVFFTLGATLLFGSVIAVGGAGQAAAGSVATAGLGAVPAITGNSGLVEQIHGRSRGYYSFGFSFGGYSPYYRGYGYPHRPHPYPRQRIYRAPHGHNYYRNSHVRWCLNRYRSYNPRTNLWFGYDGYYHQCRSPFSR